MSKKNIPLSQDETKLTKASKEECIAELQRIAEIDTTKIITRNYFRVHSKFAESAWNAHFGTFQEFKSQANITLSRAQFRLEKGIAKHASVDILRDLSKEKANREGTYLRPDKKRFQTVLVGSDVHDIECDPFWLECFIDTAKRVKPEKIVLNGDIFDLPEFGKYTVDPRTWDVVGRIKWVHEFLAAIRAASPDSEITLIEGNHEYRLLRHLAEQSPAMVVLLSDLHGYTVSKLLGLDDYEVNYVSKSDLTAFTQKDVKDEVGRNYKIFYDCLLAHHFPQGRQMGYPGFNGHHHKHIVWPFYNPTFGSTEWHQVGCGHQRDASYTNGEVWSNGFMLCNVDTKKKHVQFEYVEVKDFAVIGGKWYTRR